MTSEGVGVLATALDAALVAGDIVPTRRDLSTAWGDALAPATLAALPAGWQLVDMEALAAAVARGLCDWFEWDAHDTDEACTASARRLLGLEP